MTIRGKMLGTVAVVFLALFAAIGVVYLWGGSVLTSNLKGAGVESVSQSAEVFRGVFNRSAAGSFGFCRVAALRLRQLRGSLSGRDGPRRRRPSDQKQTE